MNFFRTYLTIGSVVAALRIIWSVIITHSNRLYEICTLKHAGLKWLLERPFVQALNCLMSIVTWPLDLIYIAAGIIKNVIFRRNLEYNIKLMTKIFEEEDEDEES